MVAPAVILSPYEMQLSLYNCRYQVTPRVQLGNATTTTTTPTCSRFFLNSSALVFSSRSSACICFSAMDSMGTRLWILRITFSNLHHQQSIHSSSAEDRKWTRQKPLIVMISVTNVCVYVCVSMHACTCICMDSCACACVCVCMCVCML